MMLHLSLPESAISQHVDAVERALRPLLEHRLPHAAVRYEHCFAGLQDRGVSPDVALAVALVPRSPFVPRAAWRLADALSVGHTALPAPAHFAALLDATLLAGARRLVVVESAMGWCTLVVGVLALLSGTRAGTTASTAFAPRGLADAVAALRIDVGLRAAECNAAEPRSFVFAEPRAMPPREWSDALVGSECAGWIAPGATGAGPGRVLRMQRRSRRLAISDLGGAE